MKIPALHSWKPSYPQLSASMPVSMNASWKEKLQPTRDKEPPLAKPLQLNLLLPKHQPWLCPNMLPPPQDQPCMTRLLPWNWITNEFPSLQTKSDAEWSLENSTLYASGVETIIISLWTALQP